METRPVYNNQGDVVDFQVIGHREGSARIAEQDYIQQSDGSFKHLYQDVSLESDQQDVSPMNFNMSEYQQAVLESTPGLSEALDWVEHAP